MNLLPVKRAILSVTDKTGLAEFGKFLVDQGCELVSTGGTKKMLQEAGLPVTSVSDVTDFPEILGGRVKTLHPHIHGGILADKDDEAHMETLRDFGIEPFDLICVNLYNFADAVAKGLDLKAAVEQIDIGGPTMLRATAKNFHSICVVPDPQYYATVQKEIEEHGGLTLEFRKEMATLTFRLTSEYDAMITKYLSENDA
ncbi:MAG: IMP cyclohydrolase [Pseudodesulfovibrio sp.]|jgi:phosphoribosylaminoimidazolecarboxamide formyltransferase/IMP cyclohydrolase|uniref:IMP cyclohydrolase n=1 Tax=Pseudodesulfovibrio indicus TaxID=1716143 RepID=A0A126QNA7_9BACT|nr:IMP cyclohydrolase [Pseudodesulfovibrio indicus]AMK11158.1 IMP cyclohydrolase [Pseudodesulfovibrio indicus]TDT92177.1 phosphoribosylaminoimidazolecarboxamide formyltransferase/IMP cyclohydrolase [Pseudodesulfovibrio indicus]